MKMYPVKFECVDDLGEVVFTVSTFDEACASVEIRTVITLATWDQMYRMIRSALVEMDLETSK